MSANEEFLPFELKRLMNECHVQSKSSNPSLALKRMASSLNSLLKSLETNNTADNPLTEREKEVLFYVSQGFTNREIAQGLSLSEKTIEYHLKLIFQKTESASRTESVKNALKNKWLSNS